MEAQDLLADGGSSSELTFDGGCCLLAGNVWEGDHRWFSQETSSPTAPYKGTETSIAGLAWEMRYPEPGLSLEGSAGEATTIFYSVGCCPTDLGPSP